MYTVVYRTGGTEACVWKRCLPVATKVEALAQAADIQRMGYTTIVHLTSVLDIIGMPEGWTA